MHPYIMQMLAAVEMLAKAEAIALRHGARFTAFETQRDPRFEGRVSPRSIAAAPGLLLTSELMLEGAVDPDHTGHFTLQRLPEGAFVSIVADAKNRRWAAVVDGDCRCWPTVRARLIETGVGDRTTMGYHYLPGEDHALAIADALATTFVAARAA